MPSRRISFAGVPHWCPSTQYTCSVFFAGSCPSHVWFIKVSDQVKRALTWAETGLSSIPKTPEGNFSRANWGDHYRLHGGRYVLVKGASNIVSVIDKLRDIQWERILTEAEKYSMQRNGPSNLKPLQAGEDQSDFELEDWDDEFE